MSFKFKMLLAIFFSMISSIYTLCQTMAVVNVEAFKKIKHLGEMGDLDALVEFIKLNETEWRQNDLHNYGTLILEAVTTLRRGSFNGSDRSNEAENSLAAREMAQSTLDFIDLLPATVYSKLIFFSDGNRKNDSKVLDQRAEILRAEDVVYFLKTWRHFLDEYDECCIGYDPLDIKNWPSMNVYPPAELGLMGPCEPSEIKDPVLRAEYELAIKKNDNYIHKNKQRNFIHSHIKSFPDQIKLIVASFYSRPPYRIQELADRLEVYQIPEDDAKDLLNRVSISMKAHGSTP